MAGHQPVLAGDDNYAAAPRPKTIAVIPCYYSANADLALSSARMLAEHGVSVTLVGNSREVSSTIVNSPTLTPPIVTICPGRNLGFGGAVNAALSDPLLASNAEWVLVINDDVVMIAPDVERMCSALGDAPPAVACLSGVNPGVRLPRTPGPVGGALRVVGLARLDHLVARLRSAQVTTPSSTPIYIESEAQAPFWFVAIRVSALRSVGGFPPDAPLYFEDVMVLRRLQKAGWAAAYVTIDSHHRRSVSGKLGASFVPAAAASGYVAAMSDRGMPRRLSRALLLVSAIAGLPLALLRKGRLRSDLVAGLVGVVRWTLRPESVELPY